jgi:hypothetical protein
MKRDDDTILLMNIKWLLLLFLRVLIFSTLLQMIVVAICVHGFGFDRDWLLVFTVMLTAILPTFFYTIWIDAFVAAAFRRMHNRRVSRFGHLPVGSEHVYCDFNKQCPGLALLPETKAWMKQTLRGYYGLYLPIDGWSDDLLSQPPIFRIWFSNEADRLAFAMKYNIYARDSELTPPPRCFRIYGGGFLGNCFHQFSASSQLPLKKSSSQVLHLLHRQPSPSRRP